MTSNDLELSADDQKALDEMRNAPAEPEAQQVPAEQALEREQAPQGKESSRTADAQPEQPRAPDGKFATKAEEQPKPPEQPKQEGEERHVPLGALKEEREKRQNLQRDFDQYKGTIEERLRVLQERLKPPAEQPKAIDVEQQPIEALKETRQQVQQLGQHVEQQQRLMQFSNYVGGLVNQFKTNVPDYDEAYRFAKESTAAELKARGYSDAEIPQIIANGEFQLAQEALQRGKNPGQHFYEFAQARGYRKPEPQPQPQPQSQVPSGQQKLHTIAKGQEAARSLGSAGGAADTQLTLERLVEMTPEQLANLPEDQFRKIMGAR